MFWSTSVWARDKNCKAGYMFCKAYSVFIALITLNKLVEKKRFQTELWLLQLNWMMPFCTSPSPSIPNSLPLYSKYALISLTPHHCPFFVLYCVVLYWSLVPHHFPFIVFAMRLSRPFLPFVNTRTHFWAIVLGNILMLRIQSALCVIIEPLFWNILMLWIEYQLYAIIIPLFFSVIMKLKCAMNLATID